MSADPDTQKARDQEANRLESLALTIIFATISTGLLAVIGVATKANAKGWWTQPWLMPAVALTLLAGANLITLWRALADLRQTPATAQERAEARAALIGWLRPIEFLAYYAAYVWGIGHLGYFAATLVFVVFLLWRVGLATPRWMLAGLGLSLFMIGVFRFGLGVWMPAPALYDHFPDAMRNALIRWF
ncbi:MAG: tripartite tricarboxylate transporter TctB family protein [Paracoccaceae bacterium]